MKWLWFLAGLWLAGCTTPTPVPSIEPEQAWQVHKQHLAQLQEWHLSGRLAIINGEEVWNLNVRWQQKGGHYEIFLAGPFGSGQIKLVGDDGGGVILRDAEQHVYFAEQPEELLYEHTGVRMPVTGLRYWILGLPDPGKNHSSEIRLDGSGRLAHLRQRGWKVEFREYTLVNNWQLPEKLVITHDDLKVLLVVHEWRLSS